MILVPYDTMNMFMSPYRLSPAVQPNHPFPSPFLNRFNPYPIGPSTHRHLHSQVCFFKQKRAQTFQLDKKIKIIF